MHSKHKMQPAVAAAAIQLMQFLTLAWQSECVMLARSRSIRTRSCQDLLYLADTGTICTARLRPPAHIHIQHWTV
jgi:hypothetical protein